jgi:hypothetical protein
LAYAEMTAGTAMTIAKPASQRRDRKQGQVARQIIKTKLLTVQGVGDVRVVWKKTSPPRIGRAGGIHDRRDGE